MSISLPYHAAAGQVFVEQREGSWVLMKESTAKRRKLTLRIIRCFYCPQPAVRLDHYFPYYQDMNACTEHKGKKL